ncbi:hypothetical protein LMH87_007183 [Akanthomyces muscarius]|uniref:Uncharacterized protein n=1 Tax=Akanthomyces muscarius TaxID=2231603 RepID=A0A9W8QPR0_AKAMU|nr:hypothetical protein LMH87_007183 [Akanthomyces muscarius]KAJ4165554.1 hypothetical protein LMH87_007183 [Akanthomyces muscarius]
MVLRWRFRPETFPELPATSSRVIPPSADMVSKHLATQNGLVPPTALASSPAQSLDSLPPRRISRQDWVPLLQLSSLECCEIFPHHGYRRPHSLATRK